MKTRFAILLLGALALPGAAAVGANEVAEASLARRAYFNGQVSLLVPRAFRRMPADIVRLKYPGRNRPTIVLTEDSTEVNIGFNHSRFRMEPAGLTVYVARLRSAMQKVRPNARIFRSDVVEIGGRRFMLFHMETQAVDTRIDNYIVGTVLAGRLLLITFNSTVAKRASWAATRARIIRSIRIRE